MSRATFDLRYIHEMAALAAATIPVAAPRRHDGRDLTARLRCLKALIDAERIAPPGTRRRAH